MNDRLIKLAQEASKLADELKSSNLDFRMGDGIVYHLLYRCGHIETGVRYRGDAQMPTDLSRAVAALVWANSRPDEMDRKLILITALNGLSNTITNSLAHAAGMAAAVSGRQ